jgi:hypothetical protein
MTKAKEQVLPHGWELLRFPVTIEIRDENGVLVHAQPYDSLDSEWNNKHKAIERAIDPCLRSINQTGESHAFNGWQYHYK